MTFEDAVAVCHVRSAVFRASAPEKRYPKNHTVPLREPGTLTL